MILLYHLADLVKIPLPGSLGFISSHFWLGVPLFYTISGFALAYGYGDRLNSPAQVKRFYIRRLFRIAPLFYTMLCIWLLAYWVIWRKTFSLQTIALNVSFLFGLVPGQHESIVWAGWSIGIEMLFYLIFPVIAALIPNLAAALGAFVVSCLLSAVIFDYLSAFDLGSYAYMNLGTQLPFFLAGIAGCRLWQNIRYTRVAIMGWGLLVTAGLLAVIVTAFDYVNSVVVSLGFERNFWAVVFSLLLLSACHARNPLLESTLFRNLGNLSFSIYLTHPMIMLGLMKLDFPMWVAQLSDLPLVNFVVAAFFTIALVWMFSSLSFALVEAPGIKFGKRLAKRFR